MNRFMPVLRRVVSGDPALPMRLRLFQLICATVALLCLVIILPSNLVIRLPALVNVGDVLLGLFSLAAYAASRRGQHWLLSYIVALVAMLDLVWFFNAGSYGSLTYYFFPALLYPMAMFRHRLRWIVTGGIIVNACALLVVEQYHPEFVTPFVTPSDRLLDLLTGVYCSAFGIVAVLWLILDNYDREQERLTGIAAELEAGERRYREIFNATKDAILILDTDGRILDLNTRALETSGFDRPSALALHISDLGSGRPPFTAEGARQMLQRALREGPQTFEWHSRRRDGTTYWAETHLHATRLDGQVRLIAVARDITERKRVMEELRRNEERLRLALEATNQGWFEINVQTGQGVSSAEYVRIIGEDPATFRTTLQNWLDGLHPDERPLVEKTFREVVAKGTTGILEYRRRKPDGGWLWIRSMGRIVEYDEAGRPLIMRGTHADVTERKQLEQQLLHSQRLEAIGTLSSGIAHDLNNILTPILMTTGLVQERLADPRDREQLAMVQREAQRGAAIIRQLLLFSRKIEGQQVVLQPRHLVLEMAHMMRETLPRNIKVIDDARRDLWCVEADATQLNQVLMNLCVNARDAMPNGGTLTLTATNVPADKVPPMPTEQPPVPCVRLDVADTGTGIEPALLERIFDPFFTTKGVGHGTGLGLSTVLGIVRGHRGFVTVDSQPGHGTTFSVFLPAKLDAAPATSPAGQLPGRRGAGELILVVDDESSVLSITRTLLERRGYRVLAASSGEEALAAFSPRAREVALVITDIMMPGMDGLKLTARLRELSPDLTVIGVSGINHDSKHGELARLGFAEILSKPYDLATMLEAVQRHLRSR